MKIKIGEKRIRKKKGFLFPLFRFAKAYANELSARDVEASAVSLRCSSDAVQKEARLRLKKESLVNLLIGFNSNSSDQKERERERQKSFLKVLLW